MLIQSFWSGAQKSAFSVGPRRSDVGDSGHTGPGADSWHPCLAAGEAILDEELETMYSIPRGANNPVSPSPVLPYLSYLGPYICIPKVLTLRVHEAKIYWATRFTIKALSTVTIFQS